MELDKQQLIVDALLKSRDLMAMCSAIIKPSYFDPSLKKPVKFILDYFNQYKDIPKTQTVRAESGYIAADIGEVNKSDLAYIAAEVESFCRNRAMTEAIIAGPELIQKEDFGKILETLKAAVSVGLQKDLGMDYFQNPEERLRQTLLVEDKLSTGIPELDDAIGGGVGKQELLLFAANSGGGKSMTMLNVAKNFLSQGKNGVYISLEMSENIVSKRLDTMITRISQENLIQEISKVASLVEKASTGMGKFIIKRMPENRTNVNTVRSYLQQLEQSSGFKPDFIVIDYIDIMGTTMTVSADNVFAKDKFVTEEVRSLGFDFDCCVISASQLGRSAVDAEKFNHAHIQGGLSKIQTSDYVIGIKQDDVMRSAGEIYLEVMKSRNSGNVGKRILLGWDSASLSITSMSNKNSGLSLKKKTSPVTLSTDGTVFNKPKNEGLLGLMN